jgi:hypothetical protein
MNQLTQYLKPDPNLMKTVDRLKEVTDKLTKHIMIESMPASMKDSRILTTQGVAPEAEQGGQAPPPEAPTPAGGQPAGPGVAQPNPAGNVPMGNVPTAGNFPNPRV